MQLINKNFRKGEIKVKIENLDDLWYLSQIIDSGDIISGKTHRKIKIGGGESAKTTKKLLFLSILVDRIEFHKSAIILRVLGTTNEEKEEVPKGSHHTFNLEENTIIKISKKEWLKFHKDRLSQATNQKIAKILICTLDREEAYFALSKNFGYELISKLKGDVKKKEERALAKGQFYNQVTTVLLDYNKRYAPNNIIVASPAFFKEDFLKQLKEDSLKKKIVLATCSTIGENGVREVLKRSEVQHLLKHDRIVKETEFVDKLLEELSKNGLGSYGVREVKKLVEAGAVEKLLVSDSKILKARQANKYKDLENLMKFVEQSKGEVHIISSDNEAGKKLDGLTGVAAILRFKFEY